MEQTIINAINEKIATVDIDAMNKEYDWNYTRGKAVANKKAKTEGYKYFTFRNTTQIKTMIDTGEIGIWATDTYYVYCEDVYLWNSEGTEDHFFHTNCYVLNVNMGHSY